MIDEVHGSNCDKCDHRTVCKYLTVFGDYRNRVAHIDLPTDFDVMVTLSCKMYREIPVLSKTNQISNMAANYGGR